MHARRRHGVRDAHAAVDHIDDHLQHGGGDAAAARRAGDEERLAVLQDDGRRHRRHRPFARPRLVGLEADQAVGIWRVRLGGKIVELVVEENAGAVGDQADAVAEIERVGVGHRIAETVDDRKMRRVMTFGIAAAAGADGARRRCVLGIDAGAQAWRHSSWR